MNEKAQRIVRFFAEHEVSEADQAFWRDLFAKDTSDQAAEGLFEFLTSYPQEAGWMRGMVEKKAQAMRDNDEDALVALVEEEAKYIETLQGK